MLTHLTYPVLGYYRSQHEHQSWLGALTMILDTCALVLVGIEGVPAMPAQATFAMARHAAVDLMQVMGVFPSDSAPDRLPEGDLATMLQLLRDGGVPIMPDPAATQSLSRLRRVYEPYVEALSRHLQMPLAPWLPPEHVVDNWRSSPWSTMG